MSELKLFFLDEVNILLGGCGRANVLKERTLYMCVYEHPMAETLDRCRFECVGVGCVWL